MGSARCYDQGRRGKGNYSVKRSLCDAVINQVVERLRADGCNDFICEDVRKHFLRLPSRYTLNVDPLRHEDVLLHTRLLQDARMVEASSGSRTTAPPPQIHVRKVQLIMSPYSRDGFDEEDDGDMQQRGIPIPSSRRCMPRMRLPKPAFGSNTNLAALGGSPSGPRSSSPASLSKVAPCPLPRSTPPRATPPSRSSYPLPTFGSYGYLATMDEDSVGGGSSGEDMGSPFGFEITVATADRYGLLKYLTTALSESASDVNIREAHVFSTTDGMALEVFVVEGWPGDDIEELRSTLLSAVSNKVIGGPFSGDQAQKDMHDLQMEELRATVEAIAYEDWAVNFDELEIGERLGGGYSGRLHRGKYKSQDVAIKVIELDEGGEMQDAVMHAAPVPELLQMFKQEVAIMRLVRHRNVVQFIGACSCWPKLCIVTELMAGGSVRDVLDSQGHGMELTAALKILRDAARGMDYVHKRGIVHRDLKAANLLIDEHDVVKVCDFGVARLKPEVLQAQGSSSSPSPDKRPRREMTAETGTYRWMAPEVLEHKQYDHLADVYSFGITMWEVLTGELPYSGLTPLQAAIGVVQRQLRPPIPSTVPSRIAALLERCWSHDPKNRPEFNEIVSALEDAMKSSAWRKGFFGGGKAGGSGTK